MSYSDLKINSNSKFLKIEAGSPHDIRILNAIPEIAYKHARPGAAPITCNGASCMMCAGGDSPIQKFLTNVYDHNTEKILIWEFGGGVAKQLKAIDATLKEDKSEITQIDLRVDCSGSGKDKRYNVTPRINSKPVPLGLKMHKLTEDIPF